MDKYFQIFWGKGIAGLYTNSIVNFLSTPPYGILQWLDQFTFPDRINITSHHYLPCRANTLAFLKENNFYWSLCDFIDSVFHSVKTE